MMLHRIGFLTLSLVVVVASARADVTLKGRVVDQDSKSVPDARVSAIAPAMGKALEPAAAKMLAVECDSRGRFTLKLPFADLSYAIQVTATGYDQPQATEVAAKEQNAEVLVHVHRGPRDSAVHARITAGTQVANNLPASLFGENGFRAMSATLENGSVDFEQLPRDVGNAIIVLDVRDISVPLQVVKPDVQLNLTMGDPGTIRGTVVDEKSGSAIAGATILAHPTFANSFNKTGTSDTGGKWAIPQLPPGDYYVEPDHADYFDPPTNSSVSPFVKATVKGAVEAQAELKMRRKATVSGMVVSAKGEPVSGAVVALPVTWKGDPREQIRWVRTDAQGKFSINTGKLGDKLTLSAFEGSQGLNETTVEPLNSGETRGDVKIVLPGK